jgi:hypothetical protein
MIRRLLVLLLALLPMAAQGQAQPQPQIQVPPLGQTLSGRFLEGSWGLRLDGSVVMRFDLKRTADGWTGGWVKPTSFASDGQRFGSIKMPAVERLADTGRSIGEWAEITFNDPRPGEEPDQFRIRLIAPDRAEMIYVGTGLPPFTLERVGDGALLGPFEEGRVYGPRAARTAAAPPAQGPTTGAPAQRPQLTQPLAPRPAAPPPAQRPPPPDDAPVQGPPAMIGR